MPGDRTYNFVIKGRANVEAFRRQMRKESTPASQRRAMEELDHIFGYEPPQEHQEPKVQTSYFD